VERDQVCWIFVLIGCASWLEPVSRLGMDDRNRPTRPTQAGPLCIVATMGRLDALNEDGRALYEATPADGSRITNRALRTALGWTADADDERYFKARNAVEDARLIARNAGHGGTVRRLPIISASQGQSAVSIRVIVRETAGGARPRFDLCGR
jgi:hypothetical protein